MTTYRTLYHGMGGEAIDLYDEGKGILAREVLKKSPCWKQIIAQRYHSRRTHQQYRPSEGLKKSDPELVQCRPPQAVCRPSSVTRASR